MRTLFDDEPTVKISFTDKTVKTVLAEAAPLPHPPGRAAAGLAITADDFTQKTGIPVFEDASVLDREDGAPDEPLSTRTTQSVEAYKMLPALIDLLPDAVFE